MKWASAVSDKKGLRAAVGEAAADLRRRLGAAPDFVAAFVSRAFSGSYEEASALIREALPAGAFVGCSAGGVIGAGRELEGCPGVSLTAALLPGVKVHPFSVQDDDMPDLDDSPRAWADLIGARPSDEPQFLVLADPFSIRADALLMGLDYAFPRSPKVGGLASGASEPHENALFLGNLTLGSGAVGVSFTGDVRMETIVAQGCRPVGPAIRVTEARQNVLISLDGKPPLDLLQEVVGALPTREQELAQTALFVGLAVDAAQDDPEQGDFLVRNIVGLDRKRGYIAVAALPRPGQTLRFHVRDARTSADDLRRLLSRAAQGRGAPAGAMMFSCLGRGRELYGEPDVDSGLFSQRFGDVALGGFFCNGEIGPVNGATHLHGFTSCLGLFAPRKEAP